MSLSRELAKLSDEELPAALRMIATNALSGGCGSTKQFDNWMNPGHTEQKTKTIVVMKEMFESAQRLNKLLRNTRIKWDGSDTKPEDIQSLQDELDRRGVVLPSARSEPKPLPANKGSARDGAMRILQAYEKEFAKTPEAREPAPALA
jgi:hypothetical protein